MVPQGSIWIRLEEQSHGRCQGDQIMSLRLYKNHDKMQRGSKMCTGWGLMASTVLTSVNYIQRNHIDKNDVQIMCCKIMSSN